MTPKQITIVIIRLLVFYSFLRALGMFFTGLFISGGHHIDITLLISGAIWLLLWLFFWKAAPKLADFLLPAHLAEPAPLPQNPALWLNTGIVLIGLWLLISGLSSFATALYSVFISQSISMGNPPLADLAGESVRIIGGLLLCCKPVWFSRLIRSVIS